MFSIYSIAFNVVKNNFAYEEAIENACKRFGRGWKRFEEGIKDG